MMNQHQQQQLQHQHQQQMMNQNPQMMSMNQHQQQQVMLTKPSKHIINSKNSLQNSIVNPMMNANNANYSSHKTRYLRNSQSNNLQMMNQPPLPPLHPSMNRSYDMWQMPPSMDQMKFQQNSGFVSGNPKQSGSKLLGPRSNWKGKKVNDKRKDGRRKDTSNMSVMAGSSTGGIPGGIGIISGAVPGGGGGYKPPTLNELQHQNSVKARRFFTKKKFNPQYHTHNNSGHNMGNFAPRNTTSFIIRAKKSGGIAELVSPCPVTPAVLPTPIFSPSREVLVDMAKEEFGVDGYGSMKGLIRLRSPGREDDGHEGDEDDDEGGSSESDVEEHVEVERRLDHDLSRFEMIYPNHAGGMDYSNVLENRVDDQDTHIAQLEEENLILKERLFLMERELGDLRRRMQCLERLSHVRGADITEEVVENETDNDSESHGEAHSVEDNKDVMIEENTQGDVDVKGKEENLNFEEGAKAAISDAEHVDEIVRTTELEDENIGEDAGLKNKNNEMEVEKQEAIEENPGA